MILDGVNLASSSAETDADALVSRLQRVLEAQGRDAMDVRPLVGYLASPNGLNGEWIEHKLAGAEITAGTMKIEIPIRKANPENRHKTGIAHT